MDHKLATQVQKDTCISTPQSIYFKGNLTYLQLINHPLPPA